MKRTLLALVRLFPAEFREQFGAEMEEQIARDYDVAVARGIGARLWFALVSGLDLMWSALAERVRPTWNGELVMQPAGAHAGFTEEEPMRSALQEWMRDIKLAGRSLRRSPGFAAITIGTLGLAIGATSAMFGVIDKVLLDPLPFHDPDRLVHIAASAPGSDLPDEVGLTQEMFLHYRERSKLVEGMGMGLSAGTSTFRVADRVERVRMSWPSNDMYRTLGVTPIVGRLPRAEDENRVVLLSEDAWNNWFGRDSAVIGKQYFVSDGMKEVIGIMPRTFIYPFEGTMLWIAGDIRTDRMPPPGQFRGPAIARLKPGVTVEQLQVELTSLSKELPARFGGTPRFADLISKHRAVVRPLEEQALGNIANPLWVVFAAVVVVLMISWANVANLFMVRSEGRQREMIVRRAVGAARLQLVRLQMSEALVVAYLAAVLAVGIAWVGLPLLVRASPPNIPRMADVGFTPTTLIFTLLAAFASALACGLIPAIRASSPDLSRLRESGRSSTRHQHYARNGLVVAQTAMALVLLIGAGLLMRSFAKLTNVDPGYQTADIFTFQFAPDFRPGLNTGPQWGRFHMDFMERLRALPGVEQVGVINNIPLDEGTGFAPFRTDDMEAGGDPNAAKRVQFNVAAGDVFKAMGIKLIAGETFAPRDLAATNGKVVVSKSAANVLWPGQNAVGRRVQQFGDSTNWYTVAGVVNDVIQNDFREAPAATIYFPLVGVDTNSWAMGSPAYVIKSRRASSIGPEVRTLVRAVAPEAPMYRVYTMDELAVRATVQLRFTMLTLGIISALALILGAVGLYGVLSYVVAERTKEIGVRMALGAEASRVRSMVVLQGARVIGVGILIGVGIAWASTKALRTLLFGVQPLDMTTFVAMSLSMIAVGLLASYVPARRASNVDPMESLRGE